MIDNQTFHENWTLESNPDLFGEAGLFGDILSDRPDYCVFAESFHEFADRLCKDALRQSTVVGVNQAMLSLTKRYFQWFSVVPKRHKYHLSENGHTCIFQVFVQSYQRLMTLELSILPPRLYLPSPPPPPPPKEFTLWLGDKE